MVLKGIAKLIGLTSPQNWYPASYKFTKRYSRLKPHPDKKLTKINAAIKLDALLRLLSVNEKSFLIPTKVKGLEVFNKPRPNGLLLCSAHMPLLPVALRALAENNIILNALILKPVVKNNRYPLFGIDYKIPVINNGPNVLLKAKNILQNGGIVIALADEDTGYNNYSPNVFRLAEKINTELVYFFSELKPDGHIEVSFFEAPTNAHSGNLTTSRISALNNYRNKIFDIQQDFVIEKIS